MIPKSLPLVLLVVAAPSLCAQQLIFIDDGMDPANYANFSFENPDNEADVSFEFGNGIAGGGNPGGYLEVNHFHDVQREDDAVGPEDPGSPVGGNGDTSLQSVFINQNMPYSSPQGGAIESISFSLDVRTSGLGDLSFAIENPGGGSLIFASSLETDGEWQTYGTTVFRQADGEILGADFSQPGPYSFGFSFFSAAEVTSGEELFVYDVDNFVVTLNGIPEPSTGILLGLAGSLLAFRRRR